MRSIFKRRQEYYAKVREDAVKVEVVEPTEEVVEPTEEVVEVTEPVEEKKTRKKKSE
jgi:hypothetical protein